MLPRPRNYTQLQPDGRLTLASSKQQHRSSRATASALNRSPSTISRELRRNGSADRHASASAYQHC